jgi:hypothetical protein
LTTMAAHRDRRLQPFIAQSTAKGCAGFGILLLLVHK